MAFSAKIYSCIFVQYFGFSKLNNSAMTNTFKKGEIPYPIGRRAFLVNTGKMHSPLPQAPY
jgi:hypothetical protein